MEKRLDYPASAPGVYAAMDALDRYLADCSLEPRLLGLVQLRASQLNGCAYCVDMHWQDLRAAGESEQRLYSLAVWRESPFHSTRERAALAWTEAVTRLGDEHVADGLFAEVAAELTPRELCDLTLAVAAINAWNRLSIAARLVPASYQPAAAQ